MSDRLAANAKSASSPATGSARIDDQRRVTVTFDASWLTLQQEAALIDHLLGGEIAALFEETEKGKCHNRK